VASSLVLVQSRSSLQLPLPLTGTCTPRSPRHSVTSSHTDTGSPDVAHPIVTLRGGAKAKAPTKTLPKSPRKVHGGNAPVVAVGSGTATVASEIFNLVKAIVGVGVLSLPAGIAAFGDAPSALVPALALIAIIGVLSGYGFAIIGRVCAYTGATSYRDAWSRSVGEGTSWIPAWSTTLKTFLACLAFSMVLADTFSSLLGQSADQRTQVLLAVTAIILLPLCWMKNLASLAPFSLLGVMGMAYTAFAMTVRYLDGSYSTGGTGVLVESVAAALRPKFGNAGWESVASPSSLILVCMLSTAYMAHFNAPKFYLELQNNTLPRYHRVVGTSFGISILLMGFITAIGFLTFGANASGLVLNNYASKDSWMSMSRVAVAVSLVFSYPLAFQGCRDGVLDLLNVSSESRKNSLLNFTTILLLAVLTTLAAALKDVSFVLAFGGATLGNLLTYVYPAIMYKAVVDKQGRKERLGVTISSLSAVLGLVMGAVGAKLALDKL
jgi:amino acid permease